MTGVIVALIAGPLIMWIMSTSAPRGQHAQYRGRHGAHV